MREGCAAGWGKGGLLVGEGFAARRGRGGLLLGGRGAGEWWTARWKKAVLLGDRRWERDVLLGGIEVGCVVREGCAAGWGKVDSLGERLC